MSDFVNAAGYQHDVKSRREERGWKSNGTVDCTCSEEIYRQTYDNVWRVAQKALRGERRRGVHALIRIIEQLLLIARLSVFSHPMRTSPVSVSIPWMRYSPFGCKARKNVSPQRHSGLKSRCGRQVHAAIPTLSNLVVSRKNALGG